MSAPRVEYRVAGAAMREALRRARDYTAAAADDRLRGSDRKVLDAVLAFTASYSKLEDEIYVAEIAAEAGLNEKTTREGLKRLARAQVIEWEPRTGGKRSRLALASSGGLTPESVAGDSAPDLSGDRGPELSGDAGPSTEKDSEKSYSEKKSSRAAARSQRKGGDDLGYLSGR